MVRQRPAFPAPAFFALTAPFFAILGRAALLLAALLTGSASIAALRAMLIGAERRTGSTAALFPELAPVSARSARIGRGIEIAATLVSMNATGLSVSASKIARAAVFRGIEPRACFVAARFDGFIASRRTRSAIGFARFAFAAIRFAPAGQVIALFACAT